MHACRLPPPSVRRLALQEEGHHSPALWPFGQFALKIFPVSSGGHITHLEQRDCFRAYVVESVGGD